MSYFKSDKRGLMAIGLMAMAEMFDPSNTDVQLPSRGYVKKKIQLPRKEWKRRKKLRTTQSHSRKLNRAA